MLIDVLFPPRCVSCSVPGDWWCAGCDRRVARIPRPFESTGELAQLLAAAEHREPLTHLIKSLKYRHAKAVVPAMATMFVPLLRKIPTRNLLLIPVPLHPKRLKARGHNQSALLAEAVSELTALPLSTALIRTRHTPTQTGLSRIGRKRNVADAFEWTGGSLTDYLPLLVDDVYTTGATLDACAVACKSAGATEVWGLTVGKR